MNIYGKQPRTIFISEFFSGDLQEILMSDSTDIDGSQSFDFRNPTSV